MPWDCYMTRQQILVTTICSETFIVGALQECLFHSSSGHCIWDLCSHWLPVLPNMHRPHNSGFLGPRHCLLTSARFSISVLDYCQWSGISESEHAEAVVWVLCYHKTCHVTVQILVVLTLYITNELWGKWQ